MVGVQAVNGGEGPKLVSQVPDWDHCGSALAGVDNERREEIWNVRERKVE